jgi:hypothetical protein
MGSCRNSIFWNSYTGLERSFIENRNKIFSQEVQLEPVCGINMVECQVCWES